jgi:hypothetical protein
MTALVKRVYTTFVTAGMFVVRMLILGFMALLQLTLGGAEIRPVSKEAAAAWPFRHACCSSSRQ